MHEAAFWGKTKFLSDFVLNTLPCFINHIAVPLSKLSRISAVYLL